MGFQVRCRPCNYAQGDETLAIPNDAVVPLCGYAQDDSSVVKQDYKFSFWAECIKATGKTEAKH